MQFQPTRDQTPQYLKEYSCTKEIQNPAPSNQQTNCCILTMIVFGAANRYIITVYCCPVLLTLPL